MQEIKSFIDQARGKGMPDGKIKDALIANGWDAAVIDAALLGLEVPKTKPSASSSPVSSSQDKHTSQSPLAAALQHVLLWFFTGSSSITIMGVIASLSGADVSSQVLATMVAITLVTFTPYALLFLFFLIRLRREPKLIPGKVWSIITVCVHSIGAMIAAITLIVTAINSGEFSILISATLILILNLIIVVTYWFAAFIPVRHTRIRKGVLIAHLPVLLLLFGTLFVMSLLQLGPAKHDEQLRKDIVKTVENVRSYAQKSRTLPPTGDGIVSGSDITYVKKTKSTYEVCGEFQTANRRDTYRSYGSTNDQIDDTYVYESQFYASNPGRQCFLITSSYLIDDRSQIY